MITLFNKIETEKHWNTWRCYMCTLYECTSFAGVCVCVIDVISKIGSEPYESTLRSFEHCDKCQAGDQRRIRSRPRWFQPMWIFHFRVNTNHHHCHLKLLSTVWNGHTREWTRYVDGNLNYLNRRLASHRSIQHKTSLHTIQRKCSSFCAIWCIRQQLSTCQNNPKI